MPDQELKYKITTEGDTRGADEVARSVDKVDKSAKSAAPSLEAAGKGSKEMARGLGEGAAVGNAAVSAISQLQNVSAGGASGLLALARGGFAAGVSFKGLLASLGPFGIAAAAISIALGLISTALRSSEQSAADAKTKIDELNKAKLDLAVKQQQALAAAADLALKKIDAEFNAMQRIADAELARRKSEVDADVAGDKISKEEGARRKIALDRQREDEKRVALLGAAEAKARTLEEVERKAAEQAAAKTAEYERQTKILATLAARERALESIPETSNVAGITTANPAYVRARDALNQAKEAAKGLDQSTAETAKKLADDQAKQVEADRKRAQEARAVAKTERDTQTVEDPLRAETRRNEDRAKRERSDAEETAAKKARDAEDAKIRRTPAAIWNNRMAMQGGVDDATAEAVQRNYPGYKFAQRPKSDTPAAPLTPEGTVADLAAKAAADAAARAAAAKPSGGTIIDANGRPITVPSGQPTGPGRGAYREDASGLTAAADKVATAADSASSSSAATTEQLGKIAEGTGKIADSSKQLSEGLTTAATDLGTANESLATAITGATSELGSVLQQSVALGSQNAQAYVELTAKVRDLAQQVRTAMSQLAAARSRK